MENKGLAKFMATTVTSKTIVTKAMYSGVDEEHETYRIISR